MELDHFPEAEAEARLSAYQEAHGLPHRDDDELSVAAKGADTLAEIEGFIAKKCVYWCRGCQHPPLCRVWAVHMTSV